jgi:hypothetical protein
MFCRKCGAQIADTSIRCIHCGETVQMNGQPPPPPAGQPLPAFPNYLVQSILVTLFCCLPLGIPAIVFASQVNGKLQSGDIAGAQKASKNAKLFCWLSFGLGLGFTVIYIAVMVAGVLFGNH